MDFFRKLMKSFSLSLDESEGPSEKRKESKNLIKRIGRRGSSLCQFLNPSGMCISRNDEVYICDTGNNRIQIVTLDGHFLRRFGKKGKEDSNLNHPISIILIRDEQFMLITDGEQKTLKLFSADGVFQSLYGDKCQLQYPFALAKTQNDYVTVTDLETHLVTIFNPDGESIRSFGGLGDSDYNLSYPTYVAISRDRLIIVVDNGTKSVKIFSFSGVLLQCISSNDLTLQNQKESIIRGLTCDPEDNILVTINRNVCLIIPESNRLMKVFSSSDGLRNPSGIIVNYSGTRLIVTETSGFNELSSSNDAILVLRYDLDYLNTFKSFHSTTSRQNSNVKSLAAENCVLKDVFNCNQHL